VIFMGDGVPSRVAPYMRLVGMVPAFHDTRHQCGCATEMMN